MKNTERGKRAGFPLFLVLYIPLLVGCDPDWAPKLAWGSTVSNARLSIEFPVVRSEKLLIKKIEQMLHHAGYTECDGGCKLDSPKTGDPASKLTKGHLWRVPRDWWLQG